MIKLPRTDLLLKKARVLSGEEDYNDDDYGIRTQFLLEALNDANDFVHLHLVNEKCEPFATYKDIDVVPSQEFYDVPDDVFVDHLVYSVSHSPDGLATSFMEPLELSYQRSTPLLAGSPESYFIDNGKIFLDRTPISGVLRVRYEKSAPRLDTRRGLISGTAGSFPVYTSITIDITDSNYSANDWEDLPEYLSIVDRDGNILMKNIPVTSFDEATGVITVDTRTAEDDDLAAAVVGSSRWIVFGPNSTTHSKLPSVFELFFKEYLKTIVFEGRSQDDVKTANPRMSAFLEQLTEVYSSLPSGYAGIPQRRTM